jgi:hypothetical protein
MAADSEVDRADAVSPEDDQTLRKIARYVEEIDLYDRETKKWDRQSKRIIKRYKDDRGGDGTIESQERRFNVLWSNTQNLLPALYARNPKPDIQRRFKDADPIGRVTSDILERSVTYFCDTDHFAATSRQCVLDYLLPGRGTCWVRYVPHFKPAEEITDDIGPGDDQDEEAEAPEVIDYEEVIPDYVHREDFGYNICRTYDEVWVIWRKVYMTRRELSDRFTKLKESEINAIPLDYKKQDNNGKVIDDGVGKAIIYELWDKTRKIAVWLHKSVPDALDLRPDPLRLEHFFPAPKPLLTNLVNDSLIPVPLYVEYQDQASELDMLTARIAMMTKCLKVVGIYDASAEGLNRMFNEGTENELIPVQNWAGMQEKGGMANAYSLVEVKQIAETLLAAYEARDKVKSDLDEITGMSDIIRGETDPSETASAQKLKSGYANQRISDMQRDVQRFIRETVRIMTDIIANHFQLDTIKQISGVRLLTNAEKQLYQSPMMGHNGGPPMAGAPGAQGMPPGTPGQPPAPPPLPPNTTQDQLEQMLQDPSWEDVEALIRNKALRCFRIDIETDSIIKADEEGEKASRVEFLKASGQFLQQAVEAGQQQPELIPLLAQMLMFGVRAFPVGKELESAFNSTMQKLEKEAANPQPKPNPEMAKVQADQQLGQQKLQQEMQLAQQKAQLEAQTAQAEQEAQAQQSAQENQMEAQREQRKLEAEDQLQRDKMQGEMEVELTKAYIQQKTAIVVARIGAGSTDGAVEEQEVDMKLGLKRDDELHGKLDTLIGHLTNQAKQPQPDVAGALNNLAQAHRHATETHAQMMQQQAGAINENSRQIGNLHKAATAEKEIVRDPKTNKPTGVRIKQATMQ